MGEGSREGGGRGLQRVRKVLLGHQVAVARGRACEEARAVGEMKGLDEGFCDLSEPFTEPFI